MERGRSPFDTPGKRPLPGPIGLADWQRRLTVITGHVGRLLHHRTVWRETWEIVEHNPNFASQPYLFTIYTEHYLTAQAIGVRRQTDSGEKYHQTTGRLLLLLAEDAATITREWYCSLYPDDRQESANSDFDGFAGTQEPCASPVWFDERRKGLEDSSANVRRFVNKRVAHLDHRSAPEATVSDLDAAIDSLRNVVVDLHLVLRATGLVNPEPIAQFDWTADLRVPWLDRS